MLALRVMNATVMALDAGKTFIELPIPGQAFRTFTSVSCLVNVEVTNTY